jgi:signal transduction histidine kinase/FixJ family two-component response regulator
MVVMSDPTSHRVERPLRILLVDDDDVDRAAVRRALHHAGLTVDAVEATSLDTARAALSDGPYDCLIVDYVIPGSDGQQVIDLAVSLGVSAPAIVLTGHGDEMLASELLKRGAADYLPKSQVANGQLARSLVQVLRTHELRRREREARDLLLKHAERLHALVECSERIHAGRTLEEMVATIAVEGVRLFEARAVTVEVEARGDLGPVTRVATAVDADTPAPEGPDDIVQALRDAQGQRVGRMVLQGGVFLEPLAGSALLGKFARMAVAALENGALLRAATAASKSRDEVLAVVSHDLRSPLGTVAMGAAMLRRSMTSPNGRFADDLEVINRITRSCKRMERLIDDLLDASRLDAGAVMVAPRAMPAADLLQDALDAATLEAAAGKVRVVADEVEALRVMADRDRVLQVFSNLVGNALKFTPAEGTITLGVARAGDFARFTVTDTGAGIPAEHLPRLFDRFWKGDRSGRHSAGLGLYIARGIVGAHGGEITASSEPRGGTTFAFTLPLSP